MSFLIKNFHQNYVKVSNPKLQPSLKPIDNSVKMSCVFYMELTFRIQKTNNVKV